MTISTHLFLFALHLLCAWHDRELVFVKLVTLVICANGPQLALTSAVAGGSVWMKNVFVKRSSLARTAQQDDVQTCAVAMVSAPRMAVFVRLDGVVLLAVKMPCSP